MNNAIIITELNDFIFCPASIYFHKLYGGMEKMTYQGIAQINGSAAHKAVDEKKYTTSKKTIMGLDVYCERYNLIGKIDLFDLEKKVLRERKKKIKQIYDGYVFQLYAQFFALTEMGYEVKTIELYSMDDHKHYPIKMPQDDLEMLQKFEKVISKMRSFKLEEFRQENHFKCQNCIYEPSCDRSV